MANLWPLSLVRALDGNGNPINGAKMYFYATGTTTPATFYLDGAGLIAGSNPLVSDSAGMFAPVFLDVGQNYRVVLNSADDAATYFDVDPVVPSTSGGSGYTDENARDAIGAALRGTGINIVVNDGADTITIVLDTAHANSWSAKQDFGAGADITPATAPSTTEAGYLGAPQNLQNADYTTSMTDAGKHLYHTSGSAHTWTIDSNANVPYPIGTILTFVNESGAGNVTIAITSDTLRWTDSTGGRSLVANGTATAIKVTSTAWRLTGDGIS